MNFAQIYFRKKRVLLTQITDFRILLLLLIVASVAILSIFIIASSKARILDPQLSMTPFDPAQVSAELTLIPTGMTLHTFTKFEINDNAFIANATLWFICPPAFEKSKLENIDFEGAQIIHRSSAYEDTDAHGRDIVYYDVQIEYKGDFDYRYYPFDRHRINLVLVNKHPSLHNVRFVTTADSFILRAHAFTKDWVSYAKSAIMGMKSTQIFSASESHTITYERVVFSLDFMRRSLKQAIIVFLPLFLIFFIGILSLTFDVLQQFSIILSLSLGSTTALIFYAEQLHKISPAAGIFTLADTIYILLLSIIITTFTLQIISMHFLYKKQGETQLKEVLDETALMINIIHSMLFIIFIVIMLGTVTYTLLL